MNIYFEGKSYDIGIDYQTQKMYDAIQERLPKVMAAEKKIGKGLIYSNDVEGRGTFAQKKDWVMPADTRIVTKLGRYITKHLKIKMEPAVLADHVEKIIASVKYDVSIIDREGIIQAYTENYGNGSCMTGEENEDKLAMYMENSSKVKICLYKAGSQKARALLWFLDNEEIFLDRIYTSTSDHAKMREMMTKHIKEEYPERKLIRRINEGADRHCMENEQVREITLYKPSTDKYPYADSFASILNETEETITVATGDYHDHDDVLGVMWSIEGYMYE